MSNTFFNIFPNENFIDLCMYQFGYEQCDPGHSFGPATRNHYLFHYILSGTGTLMADNANGDTQTYSVKSGQGFMILLLRPRSAKQLLLLILKESRKK